MKTFILILVLAFTGEAFADCGWVLWRDESTISPLSVSDLHKLTKSKDFKIIDGFGSFEECKSGRTKTIESIQKDAQESGSKVEPVEPNKSFHIVFPKGGFAAFNFLCLPNGTDPRPK